MAARWISSDAVDQGIPYFVRDGLDGGSILSTPNFGPLRRGQRQQRGYEKTRHYGTQVVPIFVSDGAARDGVGHLALVGIWLQRHLALDQAWVRLSTAHVPLPIDAVRTQDAARSSYPELTVFSHVQ